MWQFWKLTCNEWMNKPRGFLWHNSSTRNRWIKKSSLKNAGSRQRRHFGAPYCTSRRHCHKLWQRNALAVIEQAAHRTILSAGMRVAHAQCSAGAVYAPLAPGRTSERLPSLGNVHPSMRAVVQTPAVEPVYRSGNRSIESPGLAAVCEGREHTDSVQPEFRCAW